MASAGRARRGLPLTATAPDGAVAGVARVGRRTKDLIKRLQPGEIAVVDHADIDRVAADNRAALAAATAV